MKVVSISGSKAPLFTFPQHLQSHSQSSDWIQSLVHHCHNNFLELWKTWTSRDCVLTPVILTTEELKFQVYCWTKHLQISASTEIRDLLVQPWKGKAAWSLTCNTLSQHQGSGPKMPYIGHLTSENFTVLEAVDGQALKYLYHEKYQWYYTIKEVFHELSFSLFVSQMDSKKSPKDSIFFISICSVSSCRCTTERSRKYRFGRYFLLQRMLQANCFLLINTYTILHTTVIWATHHLPQVDHYIISLIECSRPSLIFIIYSMLWSIMKLALMKLLHVKHK